MKPFPMSRREKMEANEMASAWLLSAKFYRKKNNRRNMRKAALLVRAMIARAEGRLFDCVELHERSQALGLFSDDYFPTNRNN